VNEAVLFVSKNQTGIPGFWRTEKDQNRIFVSGFAPTRIKPILRKGIEGEREGGERRERGKGERERERGGERGRKRRGRQKGREGRQKGREVKKGVERKGREKG
jgi:hypothetical protein